MQFWSLCRSGLWPVSGRASWRVFFAAVRSCGVPRPVVDVFRDAPAFGRRPLLAFGLDFFDGGMFRCWFRGHVPVPEWFLVLWALWLLPVRVTEFREDALFPSPSRWVAFREALVASFNPRYL